MLLITPVILQLYKKPILAPLSTPFFNMKNTPQTILGINLAMLI